MQNEQAIATTSTQAVDLFKKQLTGYEKEITNMMQEHGISPGKFMIYTANIVKKNAKLLECERGTLFGAVFAAAELGLLPNTEQHFCDIIPYNKKVKVAGKWEHQLEAQFQLGYLGIVELVYRSPEINDLDTQIVFEEDFFEEELGSSKNLTHRPGIEGKRGKPRGVYAIANLANGSQKWKYLTEETIMKFKEMSQGATSEYSPWNAKNDPERWMWRKTAIKQLWKELPKTGAIGRAMEIDNATEMGGNLRATEDGNYEIVESHTAKDHKAQVHNQGKVERAEKATSNMMFTEKPMP
jgi:recombination protein RecT